MEWIKVGNKWPEPDRDIIFVWKPNLVTMGFCINKKFYSYESDKTDYATIEPKDVSYWMYIPDPPQD